MSYLTFTYFQLPLLKINLPSTLTPQEEKTSAQLRLLTNTAIEKFNSYQNRVFNKVINEVLSEKYAYKSDGRPSMQISSTQLLSFRYSRPDRKTTWQTAIPRFLKSQRMRVLAVAFSAVAAELLDGRRTAPSTLKFPIQVHSQSTCSIDVNSPISKEVKKTSPIIWNEIVMSHRQNLKEVDRTSNRFCN